MVIYHLHMQLGVLLPSAYATLGVQLHDVSLHVQIPRRHPARIPATVRRSNFHVRVAVLTINRHDVISGWDMITCPA